MWQQRCSDVFLSGPGSAVQAAGAESSKCQSEDLQRDHRLDWAQRARQTLSALTLTVLYIQCVRVQTCCSLALSVYSLSPYFPLNSLNLCVSFHLSFHPFHFLIDSVSVRCQICLHASPIAFQHQPFVFYSSSVSVSHSVSRRWGPLYKHDGSDQRPPPLLLLGGR